MSEYYLDFQYDKRGYGDLRLMLGDEQVMHYHSRTGSLYDKLLMRNIAAGTWHIRGDHPPVDTAEEAMTITPGAGWKVRLYKRMGNTPMWEYRGFLIHPDGNRPGTLGCIGIQKFDALDLKNKLTEICKQQDLIPVNISKSF